LSNELGYPVTTEAMTQRILRRAETPSRAVFVALVDGVVAGWVDVGVTDHLQNEPYGEIGGLVVSEARRSAGVGAALVLRAEQWIRGQDLERVTVRSQIKRERAHGFYLRQGYERVKTSAVFSKVLA
jgi:(aminoalkyl)phosphonate N-acetyltransferase